MAQRSPRTAALVVMLVSGVGWGAWRTVTVAAALVATMAALSVPDVAHALTPDELITKVEAKYAKVETIKATVKQTTKDLFGEVEVTGKLLIKRPNKMRWEVGTESVFVSNGTKMWIYTKEDNQVLEYDDLSTQGGGSADDILGNLDKLRENYLVTVISSGDEGHVISLAPKATDGQFKSVKLTVGAELEPKEVVLTDTFDNVTTMTFLNVVLNAPAEDSVFDYRVPPGADLIKAN